MQLKPQDILIALKLIAIGPKPWTYPELAVALGMSPSEVHAAIKRGKRSGLLIDHESKPIPNTTTLIEFIVHGLRYVFVPDYGELTRGFPTSYAAPPLSNHIVASNDPVPVWPAANGPVRGMAFSPLYKAVPHAIQSDDVLYELLVLVDAIRGGRARERNLAIKKITKRIQCYATTK